MSKKLMRKNHFKYLLQLASLAFMLSFALSSPVYANPVDCALEVNSNNPDCPGSDVYCDDIAHQLEDICIEGKPAYCELNHHRTEPQCIVGNTAFCDLLHNRQNRACVAGMPEFCELPQHSNHPDCPGTVSYCTRFPYDNLCNNTSIPTNCAVTNTCGTPYQVNITTRSSTVGVVLCEMIYYTRSSIGRGLAILCIIMLAIMVFYQKLDWVQALVAGVGIACVFGASYITVYMATNVGIMSGILACLKG